MKKITLLFGALLVASVSQAQIVVTHSASEDIVPATTVACPTEPTQFLRVFDLTNEFGITDPFTISSVEFGVEVSETVPTTLNLYTSDSTDPTDAGGAVLTNIYTADIATAGGDGTKLVHELDAPVTVPAGAIIVMELAEAEDGVVFRIGANDAGQTAPSWLKSGTCGEGTVESFGFVNHYVMNVIGDTNLAVDDNLLSQVAVYPNPTSDVLYVRVPASVEVSDAAIYDVLGKRTSVQLVDGKMNTANLAAGVYILKATTSAGTLTEKVVKQ